MSNRGRLLGIDHGEKVIGLAICDAAWIVARPLQLLIRKNRAADFELIQKVIEAQHIEAIVVGLPDVSEHFSGVSQAHTVRRWVSRLAASVAIPVYLWDEQLSTFEAHELAAEAGAKDAARVDDRAAAVILQSFINAHPEGTPPPAPIKPR
jgi:putative Holliday junction resolvase